MTGSLTVCEKRKIPILNRETDTGQIVGRKNVENILTYCGGART